MKQTAPYWKWALAAFSTVCGILLVYDTFFAGGALLIFLRKFSNILTPILYGVFMAYLLAPVVNFFERRLFPKQLAKAKAQGRLHSPGCRAVSMLLTFLVVFFIFYLLLSILIPELYKSLQQLVANAETYYNTIYRWVNDLLEINPQLSAWVKTQLDTSYTDIVTWLSREVIPQAQQLLTVAAGSVWGILMFAKNLVIGTIVSIYLLNTKEQCAAACRKLLFSLQPAEKASFFLRGIRRADMIFSGFVRGKLLDSLIIGVICFFCCSLLEFPYTPLVSVFVGVTNIIPFFGPFLGAIPSAFLILLVSPIQCLYFILFVLVLQQVDGNIIGPKILGDSTGLSSFWVIVAILVGGGFFGLLGMFFGVPIFACAHTAVRFFADRRLVKKGMPLNPNCYAADAPILESELPGTTGGIPPVS